MDDSWWLDRAKDAISQIESEKDLRVFLDGWASELSGAFMDHFSLEYVTCLLAMMNFVVGVYHGRKN